jgi:hypothetical protein
VLEREIRKIGLIVTEIVGPQRNISVKGLNESRTEISNCEGSQSPPRTVELRKRKKVKEG